MRTNLVLHRELICFLHRDLQHFFGDIRSDDVDAFFAEQQRVVSCATIQFKYLESVKMRSNLLQVVPNLFPLELSYCAPCKYGVSSGDMIERRCHTDIAVR